MQNDFSEWNSSTDLPSSDFAASAPAPMPPMKWHKCLIYFALWLGAVMNAFTALSLFTGSAYGDAATTERVYRFYDGLKTVDIVMALLLIALAAYQIMARFALAGFKAKGPKMLSCCYIANAAITAIYALCVSSVTDGAVPFTDSISGIVGSIAMVFINQAYYNKRAHLFVK